jgi:hypothetical protein
MHPRPHHRQRANTRASRNTGVDASSASVALLANSREATTASESDDRFAWLRRSEIRRRDG